MAKATDIMVFDGTNCSRVYTRMLTMAREDGVKFHLNSGFRSVKEQWRLYRLYKAGKGALAAFPGTSTHNKRGWKQGLDVNDTDGGRARLQAWAHRHGMAFDLTVKGESWHLNARADYTHRIYVMWHNHLVAREKAAVERRRKLEEDRKARLRKAKHK